MANAVLDVKKAMFSPAEASTMGVDHLHRMEDNKHRSMPLPVDKIGTYFAHLMPGEICGVEAQTHNYKTGFMNMWEHGLAAHLNSCGRGHEAIVHVDVENTVEGLLVEEIARGSGNTVADISRGNIRDWDKVIQAAANIAGINIYRIANSLGEDNVPDLYLSNIYRATNYLSSGEMLGEKVKIACVFVDYLQALPIDPEAQEASKNYETQRRIQVRQDVYRLRRMAQYFECPIVVGVQAKQVLTGHLAPNMLIPGMYDGEETSAIAQRFDRLISLWMPKTSFSVGKRIEYGNVGFDIAENTLLVRVLKQRGGLPSGRWWVCNINFATNRIAPIEENRVSSQGGYREN